MKHRQSPGSWKVRAAAGIFLFVAAYCAPARADDSDLPRFKNVRIPQIDPLEESRRLLEKEAGLARAITEFRSDMPGPCLAGGLPADMDRGLVQRRQQALAYPPKFRETTEKAIAQIVKKSPLPESVNPADACGGAFDSLVADLEAREEVLNQAAVAIASPGLDAIYKSNMKFIDSQHARPANGSGAACMAKAKELRRITNLALDSYIGWADLDAYFSGNAERIRQDTVLLKYYRAKCGSAK